MAVQTIDRGTAGNPNDTFKIGVALDTAQANDDYLDSVNTVADLALLSLSVGDVKRTKGCLSIGDGGHGTFIVEAASGTPDGYSRVLLANGNHAVLQPVNGVVTLEQFGAVGDGVTDDTDAYDLAVTYINQSVCNLSAQNKYLVDAAVIDITRNGVRIFGSGKGNVANLTPSTPQKSELIIKGSGAGIRVRAQDVSLTGFRLTSDSARAALTFDIDSPGVRVEPDDTATARADRCKINLRIDKQPGDGILTVGSALYTSARSCDIYECKGFGIRLDPGRHPDLLRTNKHYPGLMTIKSCRVGYCGGHAIAASHPDVTTQSEMAIRINISNFDSFGNGINHAIMYPSNDGVFYDAWIFGENCEIKASALSGRQGLSLTPEINGGVWIAGRDNKLVNNRYIDTIQPIYYAYISAQPSTGLDVDMMRIINATLTHTDCVKVQSASSKGLRIKFDRYESFTNACTVRVGADFVDSDIIYQGKHNHTSGLSNSGEQIILADDTVHVINIGGMTGAVSAEAVIVIACSAVSSGGGIFHVRLNSSSPIATKWAGEANTIAYASGGALSGTTGTDGGVNVSSSASAIYIENRRGFSITLTYQILSIKRGLYLI